MSCFQTKLNLIGSKSPRNALFELLLDLKNQKKHKQLLLNRTLVANKSSGINSQITIYIVINSYSLSITLSPFMDSPANKENYWNKQKTKWMK